MSKAYDILRAPAFIAGCAATARRLRVKVATGAGCTGRRTWNAQESEVKQAHASLRVVAWLARVAGGHTRTLLTASEART